MDNNNNEFSDIGNLYDFLYNYRKTISQDFSYLSGNWADHEQWKVMTRAKVFELLGYFPDEAPLDTEILSVTERAGYTQHEVRFNTARNVRVDGTLLIPTQGKKPFPAVIALHDHGGCYFYGREKILEQDNEPIALVKHKIASYGGRSWASELARRGYVILSIDAFYFGSRKIKLDQVSSDMHKRFSLDALDGLDSGSPEYVETYNNLCNTFEALFIRHVLMSGTTWSGILFHDDRKSIDFLLSRSEVDKDRIGCCGLSLGAIRCVHLAGLDGRIKASVAAGWMPTSDSLLFNRLRHHTYMLYIPLLTAYLDIPDLASLTAPNPLLIQQCSLDSLYNLRGMQDACAKIEKIYAKLGISEKFRGNFYETDHEFNIQMQEDAFAWLEQWLK